MVAVGWFVIVGLLVAAALNVWHGLQEYRKGSPASSEDGTRELRNLRLRAAGVVLGAILAVAFVFVYNDFKRDACLDQGRGYETGLFVRCD